MQLMQNCTPLQEKQLGETATRVNILLDQSRRNYSEIEAEKVKNGCTDDLYSIINHAQQCDPLREKAKAYQQNIAELTELQEDIVAVQNRMPSRGKYVRACAVNWQIVSAYTVERLKSVSFQTAEHHQKSETLRPRISAGMTPDKRPIVVNEAVASQAVTHAVPVQLQKPVTPEMVSQPSPQAASQESFAADRFDETTPDFGDQGLYGSLPVTASAIPVKKRATDNSKSATRQNADMERPLDEQKDVRSVGPSFFPDEPVSPPQP